MEFACLCFSELIISICQSYGLLGWMGDWGYGAGVGGLGLDLGVV